MSLVTSLYFGHSPALMQDTTCLTIPDKNRFFFYLPNRIEIEITHFNASLKHLGFFLWRLPLLLIVVIACYLNVYCLLLCVRAWLLCAVGPLNLTMRTIWRAFWRCRRRRKPICSTMLNPVEDCVCVCVWERESGPTAGSGTPVNLCYWDPLLFRVITWFCWKTDKPKSDWTASQW